MRQRIVWLLFLSLGVATCASAQTANLTPTIEAIIAGMAQARAENQARFRSYVVTRDYKLFGKEKAQTKVHLIADISFIPPDTKKYSIQEAAGTGFGETIVRRMLISEVEIAKDYTSTDFSADNYDFRFIREGNVGGQRCYVLELLPKRKNKNLLRGKILVDAGTFLPRRIEGEPVKTPSWWLRSLHIELDYSDVGGMWLQTALEATATVRILGPHTMVARDVKYQLSDLVVIARPKQVPE
jgi:outer membrane lipoprotein-sorting protein